MPSGVQLNLRLPNKKGTLAKLCRELADRGVNLLALAAPETAARSGLVRLLVTHPELAERAVADAGYAYSREDVLFVELKNRPGALAKAMEKLAKANIEVRYAYATAYTKAQKTAAVVAVAEKDHPRALGILR